MLHLVTGHHARSLAHSNSIRATFLGCMAGTVVVQLRFFYNRKGKKAKKKEIIKKTNSIKLIELDKLVEMIRCGELKTKPIVDK